MKINKIFIFAGVLLSSMFSLSSCSDNDNFTSGAWDANENYANIYFPESSSSEEVDPIADPKATIEIRRRNTNGALTVPVTVTENTDDVFSIGSVEFADGDSITTIDVDYSKAGIGTTYTLRLEVDGADYVSSYSTSVSYTYSVTRVKWNDAGFYYADEDKTEKIEGWGIYTDDLVGPHYGELNVSYPVKVQERDDVEGIYRIVNAYGEVYPYNHPGEWDDSKDYYIVINATNPEKVYISPSEINLGVNWGDGYFYTLNLAGYYVERAAECAAEGDSENEKKYLNYAEDYYGKYENGVITFPAQSLYIAEEDYNGGAWYYANNSGAFSLVIDPDLNPYNADMTSEEDFEWEEVFAGSFESEQIGSKKDGVKLYKGTCINTTDSCDARFAEEYGTAYKIESPYAEGYNLYFAVNESGKVTLPDDLKYQNTGLKAVGADVYAVISAISSTFTERVITLKITFQTKPDSEGNFMNYGSAEEVLSYITWTAVGTGTYTYTSFFADYDEETDEDIPYEDGPLKIFQRDDKPNTYKVTDWGYGADFIFTWDGKDNATVPASFTGYTSPYGDVYVSDFYYYNGSSYDKYPCTYDAANNTFTFTVIYWCEAGYFTYSQETLKVDWNTPAASVRKASANKTRSNSIKEIKKHKSSLKHFSRFAKGTKTNVRNQKTFKATIGTPLFVK